MSNIEQADEAAKEYREQLKAMYPNYDYTGLMWAGFKDGYLAHAAKSGDEVAKLKAEIVELESELKICRADHGYFD